MKEDSPFLPREFQGLFQFLHILHDPKPSLGVRMQERIADQHGIRNHWCAARGKLQKGLCCFLWQVLKEIEEAAL